MAKSGQYPRKDIFPMVIFIIFSPHFLFIRFSILKTIVNIIVNFYILFKSPGDGYET
jgi:hypothetical protein